MPIRVVAVFRTFISCILNAYCFKEIIVSLVLSYRFCRDTINIKVLIG